MLSSKQNHFRNDLVNKYNVIEINYEIFYYHSQGLPIAVSKTFRMLVN